MRVNPDRTPQMLEAIWRLQDKQATDLQQMASGKRVSVPSDDPVAAAALVANHDRAKRTDQYLQNVGNIRTMLQTGDDALASVVSSLTRAVTLAVQGSSGTVSQQQRQQIAVEAQGIRDQVVQLANTMFHGVYVFGGTKSERAPFVQTGGTVVYRGNDQVNAVAIGDGQTIATNVPGSDLFQAAGASVFDSLQQLVTSLDSGTAADVEAATASVRTALDAVSKNRVFYGNAVNRLDSDQTFLEQQATLVKQEENDLAGVDLAKTITELTQAQVAQSAALSAGAKIVSQSLLDYLR